MPGKIFINYRRSDALAAAGRLHDRLAKAFGNNSLFMDVDHIPPGVDFVAHLEEQVAACDVFLAVMGTSWISTTDPAGRRRIDDPDDFVVIEIASALKREIPVIPVLLDGARMPTAEELPDAIKPLARRNAFKVANEQFGRDTDVLCAKIKAAFKDRGVAPRRAGMFVAAGLMAALAVGGGVYYFAAAPSKKTDDTSTSDKEGGAAKSPSEKAQAVNLALSVSPRSGESFKDCADCPSMVVVPSGDFSMGSPAEELGRSSSEDPQHQVKIQRPFAVGKYAVTFSEWDACVAGGGCKSWKPGDEGWGRGDRPAINVSWKDAKAYTSWLSSKTGHAYRLLTEAEREYVTRAGTTTPFWWGYAITTDQANYNGTFTYGGARGEFRRKTVPVEMFLPNPWGLYQVHGNIWEWTEDCWHEDYTGAPGDGSAWVTGECVHRVLRGGSWSFNPASLRAAFRSNDDRESRNAATGFRVARALEP